MGVGRRVDEAGQRCRQSEKIRTCVQWQQQIRIAVAKANQQTRRIEFSVGDEVQEQKWR